MNQRNQLLTEVVLETLEHFVFLFADVEEGAQVMPGAGDHLEATIDYHGGGEHGCLTIAAPVELCMEMAGNILGMDQSEMSPEAAFDAIKELANVIVGSITARGLGTDVSCVLDPPEARTIDSVQMNALASKEGSLCCRVDEHLFVALLDEHAPGA
jgi:hypothetical protein